MPKKPKKDVRVNVEEQVEILKAEAEAARTDGEAVGACKAFDASADFNRLMKMMVIYRVLQKKEYKAHGLTAEQFCKTVGEKYWSTHNLLKDLGPIFESNSVKITEFTGCKFNEIRLLGSEISVKNTEIKDDGTIEWQGEVYGKGEMKMLLGFIAESYEDRIKKEVKARERVEKTAKSEAAKADEAKRMLGQYKNINESDADPWVSLSMIQINERYESFLSSFRAFALHDNAMLNDAAQESMVEFYDRIYSDLDSIDQSRYEKTGRRYTRKKA